MLALALVLWLLGALALGASGVLAAVPRPALQGLIAILTTALLLASWRIEPVRTRIASVDPRALILLHASRFIGICFLVLHARGRLPWAFAVPGGWGDIAVASGALLVAALPPGARTTRPAILAWNTLGLADIVFVVATAARLGLADPDSMLALTRLPLALLPTFLVPLIVGTHVLIFVRPGARPAPTAAGSSA